MDDGFLYLVFYACNNVILWYFLRHWVDIDKFVDRFFMVKWLWILTIISARIKYKLLHILGKNLWKVFTLIFIGRMDIIFLSWIIFIQFWISVTQTMLKFLEFIFLYIWEILHQRNIYLEHIACFLSLENLGLLTEKLKSKWLLEMIFYVVICFFCNLWKF